MNIKQAIETISIRDLVESTGRQPTHINTAKGEYTYSAPYREDHDPSLIVSETLKKFRDYGQEDAKGDVVQMARLIMGNGNVSSVSVSEALQWLKKFSGGGVAATPAKPIQRREKPAFVASFDGERYKLVKVVPISVKSHPNNLAYIQEMRKIGLPVASRYLKQITYKDNAAQPDDSLKGFRYGIGGENDAGGYEVRAASIHSNFKTSLGPKDVSSFDGHPAATTGHIFEGRFDFLTRLQIAGETHNYHPTIVLNTGRLAARAAQVVKSRWPYVTNWHIWQHNDDEGERTTQVLIDELGDGYTVGTLNHLYDGFNDLNECWTDAAPDRRAKLTADILSSKRPNETSDRKIAGPNGNLKPRL